MFKIVSILLFLYYLKTIFVYHTGSREALSNILDSIKKTIIKKNSTVISQDEMVNQEFITGAIYSILMLVFNLIEFVFIFFSISCLPIMIVPIAYLGFWLVIFIKVILNKDRKFLIDIKNLSVDEALKQIDEFKVKYAKTTIWDRIKSIIDCAFFGYVVYIMFFI